ncbi:phosphonate metabolism protein PhnP [Marinobacterium sediminicola]|uniref:5-phospho-alpha-D-ribosyl 1,2-cyclic phosphate phosphodiesterase n=1 Tax=Marinobacterium sediminicola TaxID=518898 RepID=A0ABY1RYX3_9GAMM|nr:phosphonate metabolism protein PhnP [Marinobacterium sediminicola]ULG68104.1 phosphonate metabolism protein PhnP [Marinobacterium sediminicola]SMR73384.1 5-phospho-alpha-D-ribosyl 1,2-cyclic phosphate phosphodiesterase [Marinobacterium sediminicola]
MFEFQFMGTGNAGGVPLWGCDCPACEAARLDSNRQRRSCSALIRTDEGITLIDAGVAELGQLFRFEEVRRVLLTHFHMDHVQGLFPLRWSECEQRIPVFRPDDPEGADDLYKHPGVFEFRPPSADFETIELPGFSLMTLPLIHSRVTQGFLIRHGDWRLAYLTDTRGVPEQTMKRLQDEPVDELVLDCSEPPRVPAPRNHNDLTLALAVWRQSGAKRLWLTHISHRLDLWLQQGGELPDGVYVASDNLVLSPDDVA